MGWSAFAPQGPTVAVAVTTSASTGVQAQSPATTATNYLFSNTTSQPVFVGYGPNALAAQTGAVAPAGGGAGTSTVFLGPSETRALSFAPQSFFSIIAATGTSVVLITPGDGL